MLTVSPPNSIRGACSYGNGASPMSVCNLATSRFKSMKRTLKQYLASRGFSIFLPNRVYLEKIESEQANITWRFRGGRAGFFGSQLLITPNGRDFEYVATGGQLKMAVVPDLDLRHIHLLITKTLLTVYNLDLASDSGGDEGIRAKGHAGLGQDKSIDVQ